MENSIVNSKSGKEANTSKSPKTRKAVSEKVNSRKEVEIYLGKAGSSYAELEDWFRDERELRGYE